MASQPSVHNEERNRLRLRAWEQRNQESGTTKELNPQNVPLFGEPYKTNKGDELSNRIKKMLGSYEDVKNPSPLSIEAIPIPAFVNFSQSDQAQPSLDKLTTPPFHSQVLHMSTESQIGPSINSYSSQPTRTYAASSPDHSSNFPNPSLNHSPGDQLGLSARHLKSEVFSDLKEMSASSPDAKHPPFPHSSDHKTFDTDIKETFERPHLQVSSDYPAESVSAMDASTLNIKESPKDVPVSQANKTSTLPSQTFTPLLSSKQPCVVMTQKPTAYVRPMDGQDQVVSESPQLKQSPEPYVPVAELINKSDMGKTKIKPQFLETRTDEAQCAEDIIREMTHSWPPLLTALHTPNTEEASKFLFPAKEPEHASSCPGQKSSSASNSSNLSQQSSSNRSFEAAHSSGRESVSSSDSDSSSGSESDSEGPTEEPRRPSVCTADKPKPDTSALGHADWQLGKWIRSSQQGCSTEGRGRARVCESPAHKQLLPTQSSRHFGEEVIGPTGEHKPQLSSHQKDFSQTLSIPQDNHRQHGSQKRSSADVNFCSTSRKLSKTTTAGCPDPAEGALSVKSEDVGTTQTKDSCFTDKPKVKTKAGHAKKSKVKEDIKSDVKRTKRSSVDRQTAASEPRSEAPTPLHGHRPACGVRDPNRCSCPPRSPARSEPPSPAPPERTRPGKVEVKSVSKRGTKASHETTHKHLKKPGHPAKDSRDVHRPPRSLLVKIDLSQLSRAPRAPSTTQRGIPSKAKTSALVREQDRGGGNVSATHKHAKNGKHKKMQNVDGENKVLPRKKQKLENNDTSSTCVSVKRESSRIPADTQDTKKAKRPSQQPTASKDKVEDAKSQKGSLGKAQASSEEAVRSKEARKQKRSSGKHMEHPHSEKQKSPKRSLAVPSPPQPIRAALTSRPLLRFEERQHPVKHFIKEAKRLKHKADAEPDKLTKAFNYLDAAMFFVESGIAMEKHPQISMSSYTMFADTVELLKFVLKLKNPVDASSPSSEKDFLALCLKCQSLLQMSMFHQEHKTALKYSETLTDHFNNSQSPPTSTAKMADHPPPKVPTPANTSASGSGLPVGPARTTVAAPQAIEQMVLAYVNITSLVLSAHDMWEQADELAQRGSGMLSELDTVMGPLSLSSSMSSMVRYTRQGVHWLRLNSHKV